MLLWQCVPSLGGSVKNRGVHCCLLPKRAKRLQKRYTFSQFKSSHRNPNLKRELRVRTSVADVLRIRYLFAIADSSHFGSV